MFDKRFFLALGLLLLFFSCAKNTRKESSESLPAESNKFFAGAVEAEAVPFTRTAMKKRVRPGWEGGSTAQLNVPKAGEHDDNEEVGYFIDFLEETRADSNLIRKIQNTRLITVLDRNEDPVLNAEIQSGQNKIRTAQDGEALLLDAKRIFVRYAGFKTNLNLIHQNRRVQIVLPIARKRPSQVKADVVFVMDTTGSMGDEISTLRDTIYSIYMRLKKFNSGNLDLRFGMVLYRDKEDEYLTRQIPLTGKIEDFQEQLFKVRAGGGGDYPEDLVSGLEAMDQLNWRKDSIRLAFVITDAPAHLSSFEKWFLIAQNALRKKLKIFTIGASGLNRTGEIQLRVLSLLTRGKFIFLTYGEQGESEGEGSKSDKGKVSHHTGANYQSRNLDDIVVDNVRKELTYQLPQSEISKIRQNYHFEGTEDKIERRVGNALSQLQKQLSDAYKDNQKPNVLVLPPLAADPALKPLSEHIVNLAQLLNQKEHYFTWVDRQFTSEILQELKLQMAGFTDGGSFPELQSVDWILGGKLYFIGGDSVLFLKIVDMKKSVVLAATMIKI